MELIDLAYTIYTKLGLENWTLYINTLGKKENRNKYIEILKESLFSHKDKNVRKIVKNRFDKNILRLFDCKNSNCKKL